MQFKKLLIFSVIYFFSIVSNANTSSFVKGFSLTELGTNKYDAIENSSSKTSAQIIVDRLFDLGVRHVTLSPRAYMRSPYQSFVEFGTSEFDLPYERQRYQRLMNYIHSKGMTVGIRPIFFVIDSNGNTPLVEVLSNGETQVWWHGNVQPENPIAWFNSFQYYLENYAEIARVGRAEEFTVGAELQSLSVGTLTQGIYKAGYPELWVRLLQSLRLKLATNTRVTYDINYTDAATEIAGTWVGGGELALWRELLTKGLQSTDPLVVEKTKSLIEFYRGLDAVGVDMYRSLATDEQILPENFDLLIKDLRKYTDYFAYELDTALTNIATATGISIPFQIKEVGFRSVDRGFVNPFEYSGNGQRNIDHQAAAFAAIFQSFLELDRGRFGGICFWDVSVDLNKHGPFDIGFSPLGKQRTESVLRQYLQ